MQQSINQQAQAQQLAQQANIPSGAPIQQQQSMNPSPQTHPPTPMAGGADFGSFINMEPNAPGQQTPQNMTAGVNAQQQLLLQPIDAMRQNPMQQHAMQQTIGLNEQRTMAQMDMFDIPLVFRDHATMPQGIPTYTMKWGQLKQWAAQSSGLGPGTLDLIKDLQRLHYQSIVRSRNQPLGQPGQMQPGGPGGQIGMSTVPPELAAPVAPMGQNPMQMPTGMNVPLPGVRGPTPQEIMNIRNHPSGKMAGATDEQVRTIFMRNQQAQMHQQKQQQMTPQQLQLQQQQALMQIQMQQQQRMNQQSGQQLQQPGQPMQNTNSGMPAQTPQQKHQSGLGLPNPEQHAKYRAIQREEEERGKEPLPNIPMDPETKAATEELLKAIVPPLNNVGRVVLQWYLVTLDEMRTKAFFRAVSYPPGLNFKFTANII
jgi:hypothetical protein